MSLVPLLESVSAFLDQEPLPFHLGGRDRLGGAGVGEVFNPATGTIVARVSLADAADVDAAVQAAHAAFPSWAALPARERAVRLHRFADLLQQHAEALAQLESLDVGKAIAAARGFDVPFGIACFRYFADVAIATPCDVPLPIAGIEARQHRAPFGVCGFWACLEKVDTKSGGFDV